MKGWMKNISNNNLHDIDDGNTSDDKLEDLPYDGNLEDAYRHCPEICYINQSHSNISNNIPDLSISEISSGLKEENGLEPQDLCPDDDVEQNTPKIMHKAAVTIDNKLHGDFATKTNKVGFSNSKIPDVLLRHFSENALLNTSQFIDSETIPDTSFIESIDESIINQISGLNSSHNSSVREQEVDFEKYLLKRDEKSFNYPGRNLLEESKSVVAKAETHRREGNGVDSQLLTEAKTLEDPNHSRAVGQRSVEQKYQRERRASSSEIKYGQGQVHYRLPDFSKVASKVKIPKRHGGVRSTPVMKAAKSFPNLIDKSAVVKDVLEMMHPVVQEHEYEKRNLDPQQVSLYSASLNPKTMIDRGASDEHFEDSTVSNLSLWKMQVEPTLPHGDSTELESETKNSKSLFSTTEEVSLNYTKAQDSAEAEEMFQMLKDHTEQLKTKGEEFSKCLLKDALSLQDQSLVFKHLKECLETLEQDYLATKEKHRDLQLQSYRSGRETVGEFDPDRKVEGEIFRLGMLLEDIKEKMDDNIYRPSLSTSLAMSAVFSQSKPGSTSHTLLHKGIIEPEVTPLKENENMSNGLQNEMALDHCKEHSLQGDSCDLLSHLEAEERSLGIRKSKQGRFSIVVQEETLNLDLSSPNFGSETEDSLFSNSMITGSLSIKASDHRPKNCRPYSASLDGHVPGLNNLKFDVASEVPSFYQRKNIYSPAFHANNYRHERNGFMCNLPERQNFVKNPHFSRIYNTFMFSPQYLSNRMMYEGKSRFNSENKHADNINTKILNSVLDRAIETANSMKKTTDRMVQVISADLAKAHIHRSFETG
uniref:Protein AKNAD1 isoform X2 n=1 Tax=Geotrypetes seraphini TaxID=260995 RepID=A0A6P8N9I7_GEOSA|nr:protein AKNAD1 isoform X2 [Geotrypetes seraphini]